MITSVEEFCRLRESLKSEDYHRAAHDEALIGVWESVIEQRPDMRFWVAQNKTIPIEILEALSRVEDVDVRNMVARKRKITEEIALRLVDDDDETVRAALAWNKKLPDSALEILRGDSSELVQAALEDRD